MNEDGPSPPQPTCRTLPRGPRKTYKSFTSNIRTKDSLLLVMIPDGGASTPSCTFVLLKITAHKMPVISLRSISYRRSTSNGAAAALIWQSQDLLHFRLAFYLRLWLGYYCRNRCDILNLNV